MTNGSWGGDWNRHPEAVANGGLPGSLDARVIRPDEPTCYPSVGEPSILDFFLVGKGIAGLVTSCTVLKDTAV